MTEIQGQSILVRVNASFELARVRVIGSRLYMSRCPGLMEVGLSCSSLTPLKRSSGVLNITFCKNIVPFSANSEKNRISHSLINSKSNELPQSLRRAWLNCDALDGTDAKVKEKEMNNCNSLPQLRLLEQRTTILTIRYQMMIICFTLRSSAIFKLQKRCSELNIFFSSHKH